MKFTCIRADALTPDHIAVWDRIQRDNPLLDSPFLRPEFTTTVAAVRRDIEVTLLEDGGQIVGFFPFQRTKWGVGKPVGWNMCDVQAIIAPADLSCDTMELVKSCRLSAWDYYGAPAPLQSLRAFHDEHVETAFMDLSQGYEAFCEARRVAGVRNFKHVRKLWRKAEQEVGPVRFEAYSAEPHVWQSLLIWKSDQYLRTGAVNVFAFPWTIELLERICAAPRSLWRHVIRVVHRRSVGCGGIGTAIVWSGSLLVHRLQPDFVTLLPRQHPHGVGGASCVQSRHPPH